MKSRGRKFVYLSDEAWRRHANPWSVYTRFAAIPAMMLAVWSRVWIGWWSVAPVTLVAVWLLLNPFVFPPVTSPRSWAAKGIYGEKLWLRGGSHQKNGYAIILRSLIAVGLAGLWLMGWGLWNLQVWPSIFGATLVIMAQLWRIDRMGMLYEEDERAHAAPSDTMSSEDK